MEAERGSVFRETTAELNSLGDLDALRTYIGDCRRCSLAQTRNTLVLGVGDPTADLLFIGEAPGRNEDLRGEPFVGAAGKLLDELLASIGLHRSEVYIANVLKCRPPGNRDPLQSEIEMCTPFLAEQVRIIDPLVIATLGNFSTRHVLSTQQGITQLHGRLFEVGGRRVVPIYHPAAALYSPDKRQVLFDDFRRLHTVLQWATEGRPAAPHDDVPQADVTPREVGDVSDQPSLF
ncbi:MAG: uracil-DNA glycosylase [Coriobacteriia bacterium]|nr:uracil-DNA glycosylase [Coriobacteriia bacterium]